MSCIKMKYLINIDRFQSFLRPFWEILRNVFFPRADGDALRSPQWRFSLRFLDRSYPPSLATRVWMYPSLLLFLDVTGDSNSTCSNGLAGFEDTVNLVCCDVACGLCGGPGCGNVVGLTGNDCCSETIANNGTLCSVAGEAPCVIDLPGEITCLPRPMVHEGGVRLAFRPDMCSCEPPNSLRPAYARLPLPVILLSLEPASPQRSARTAPAATAFLVLRTR